jgi:predicted RNA binding protein YcfA (HicA-like mRNA interferase family)
MKLPRDLSGSEVVKALRRLGFVVVRQDGSHIRMVKDNLAVTVPNHRSIVPKTPQSILRHAQITVEKLRDNL